MRLCVRYVQDQAGSQPVTDLRIVGDDLGLKRVYVTNWGRSHRFTREPVFLGFEGLAATARKLEALGFEVAFLALPLVPRTVYNLGAAYVDHRSSEGDRPTRASHPATEPRLP